MLLAMLLALTPVAAPLPSPLHYRIEVKASQEVDVTVLGAPAKQTQDLWIFGFVSVTMTDTTGGQIAQIVVDSVRLAPGAELPPNFDVSPESASGIFYHGYVVRGKIIGGAVPSRSNGLVTLLNGAVDNLFPGIRPGVQPGDSWTDTNKVSPTDNGLTRTITTVTAWKVTGVDGANLTIEGTSTGATQGEVSGGAAGTLTIAGTTTGLRKITASPGGVTTAAAIQANQTGTLSSPNFPAAIPVKSTTTITITQLP